MFTDTKKNIYVIICDTELHTFVLCVTHVVHKAIVHIRATIYARWCTYNRNLDNKYRRFSITYEFFHSVRWFDMHVMSNCFETILSAADEQIDLPSSV